MSIFKTYWPMVPSTLTAIKIALDVSRRRDSKLEDRFVAKISLLKEELEELKTSIDECKQERDSFKLKVESGL